MYLVKILSSKHKKAALSDGSIRIGTFNYYRNIEDSSRQDNKEGLGNFVWTGHELTTEMHNKIFTPHDKVKLTRGWNIKNNGLPIHGSVPDYNAFVFCFSEVQHIKEIDTAAGGKAVDYYFISNIEKFGLAITEALKTEFDKTLTDIDSPESVEILKSGYEVIPTLYRVNYSEEQKSKEVNEDNIDSINPWSVHTPDLWQKPKSYKYEKEVRLVWTFARKTNIGLETFSFPQSDCEYIDLKLGKGALAITSRKVKNTYSIKSA